MDLADRDALDAALVVVATGLVYSHLAATVDPVGTVGRAVGAVFSLNPIVYLVVLGVGGILFLAYGLLYLPTRSSGA